MRFLLAVIIALPSVVSGATLPAGFTETIISGLSAPTAMAMAPDGRIFVCQQGGALRVIKNGVLLTTPFVTVSVHLIGERGLLGVAFDPDFLTNRFVYVYYTTASSPIHNRISRFTANGDVAAPGSEVFLVDLENLSSATNHNGGAIHFGRDGKLYAAVGENANGAHSQTLENRLGKMLRYNSDGTIPADNPFFATASGDNRAIWALGLRNPFTFGVHPNTGRIFINDVGAGTWEEINDGIPGANYGWPTTEGPTSNPSFVSPLHAYTHSGSPGGCAIAGGAFYAPEVRQFPSAYLESYFFADLCGGWIRRIDEASNPFAFATGFGGPNLVDLLVGPDGSLYYLGISSGVGRIRWTRHLEGDVNDDGTVDNADAFYLINHFQAGGPAPRPGQGDVNGDGQLTVADLNYLISYLLGRGPTPV